MKIVGIHFSKNKAEQTVSTLHTLEEFPSFYSNSEAGRGCVGQMANSIYLGTYDCSALKIGMEIEVYYDRAVTTGKGTTFQPVKRIEILK